MPLQPVTDIDEPSDIPTVIIQKPTQLYDVHSKVTAEHRPKCLRSSGMETVEYFRHLNSQCVTDFPISLQGVDSVQILRDEPRAMLLSRQRSTEPTKFRRGFERNRHRRRSSKLNQRGEELTCECISFKECLGRRINSTVVSWQYFTSGR